MLYTSYCYYIYLYYNFHHHFLGFPQLQQSAEADSVTGSGHDRSAEVNKHNLFGIIARSVYLDSRPIKSNHAVASGAGADSILNPPVTWILLNAIQIGGNLLSGLGRGPDKARDSFALRSIGEDQELAIRTERKGPEKEPGRIMPIDLSVMRLRPGHIVLKFIQVVRDS